MPSGRALVRKLLKNSNHALVYGDAMIVPLGARVVLEAVGDLIADSTEPGEYRLLEVQQARPLAAWVAQHLHIVGAEAEVAGHLECLRQAGLIVLRDGTMAFAQRPVASSAKAAAARENGKLGGRPPKDPMKAAEKRAQEDREAGQRSMVLPMETHVARSGTHGETDSGVLRTQSGTFRHTGPTGVFGFVGGFSVVAAESAAAAAEEDSSDRPAAAAAGSGRLRERAHTAGTDRGRRAEPSAPPQSATEPEPTAVATRLAERMATAFAFDHTFATAAPGIVQGFLSGGYTEADIDAAIDRKVEKGGRVRTAGWFAGSLQEAQTVRQTARNQAGRQKPILVEEEQPISWPAEMTPAVRSTMSADVQVWTKMAIEALSRPTGQQQRGALRRVHQQCPDALHRAADLRPDVDVYELAELEGERPITRTPARADATG